MKTSVLRRVKRRTVIKSAIGFVIVSALCGASYRFGYLQARTHNAYEDDSYEWYQPLKKKKRIYLPGEIEPDTILAV